LGCFEFGFIVLRHTIRKGYINCDTGVDISDVILVLRKTIGFDEIRQID